MTRRRVLAELMRFRPPKAGGFRILLYHSIRAAGRGPASPYAVDAERFAEQMAWLAAHRSPVLPMGEAVGVMARGARLGAGTVVLSFDDGYRDNLEHAAPIVGRYGFRPTIFLCPGLLGDSGRPAAGLLALPLLGIAEVRALIAAGWEMGGHSVTHRLLTSALPGEIDSEVGACRTMLRDLLGLDVRVFAYPFGRFDGVARDSVVRHGFAAACSGISGYNRPATDVFALHRISILGDDSIEDFALKVRGAYDWVELLDRRRMRRQVTAERRGRA